MVHAKWIKKVCWNSLVVVTQIGPAIRQDAKVSAGCHCDVQNVTLCNRSLKQTAISLSSCDAEFFAASVCAGELLGLAELFKELHNDVSVRLEVDSDSARHTLQRRRPGGLKHIEIRCLAIQTVDTRETSICKSSGHEEQHCRSLHEVSGWIANTVVCEEAWASNSWMVRTEILNIASSRGGV